MQLYGRFKHGRDDVGFVIPSKEASGLHDHFSSAFEDLWNSVPDEQFIADWPPERVTDLAMLCHLPQEKLLGAGQAARAIAHALCEHLQSLAPDIPIMDEWRKC